MRFEASFRAPASRWSTAMNDTMGRAYAGYFGAGSVEIVQGALVLTAKRHRYAANFVGGFVGALAGAAVGYAGLRAEMASPGRMHGDPGGAWAMLALFGFLLGAFLVSILFRFSSPVTVTLPFSEIERAKVIGSQVHLFRKSGDVDILVRTIPEVQALMGTLASVGVRTV